MNIKQMIEQVEAEMAPMQAQIDAINERLAPVDAEIDAQIAQEQAIRAQMTEATAKLEAARGMPGQEYLAFKRKFGQLASTRMQLRKMLEAG